MQAMPAFLWNKRGVLVSHRGSLNLKNCWSSVVAAFVSKAEGQALGTSASTMDFHRLAFAPSADAPCNTPRPPPQRENRDSDPLARLPRRPRSDGAFQWGCAIDLQSVCVVSKRRVG